MDTNLKFNGSAEFIFKGQLHEIFHSMREVLDAFEIIGNYIEYDTEAEKAEEIEVRFTVDADELISTMEDLTFIATEHRSMPGNNSSIVWNQVHVKDRIDKAQELIRALK